MVNTKHKDRLFCFIFGTEENKSWTLDLYNAVNNSSHEDPDAIQITTMEDVLYMGMKNDVSFIIADIISIYEQQSTFNPNMPLRELMYVARLYDKYIHINKLNIYGSSLIPLPTPKLVVFYNGKKNVDDDCILELKDAFQDNSGSPDISVRVRMININYNHSHKLMEACKPLAEYAWLIQRIRDYSVGFSIDSAVDRALDELPEDFLIRPFLIGNKAEVKQMCITEYNETETLQLFKEQCREEGRREGRQEGRREGRQEGRREGRQEGRQEGILGAVALLKEMNVPISDILLKIQQKYNLTPEESQKFL